MDGEVRHRRKRTTLSAQGSGDASTKRQHVPPKVDDVQNGASETKDTVHDSVNGPKTKDAAQRHWSGLPLFIGWISCMVGVILLIAVSVTHAMYMFTLHENDLWFSNIKEVEREISFRTESGLYYSYYKQLVNAPSLTQGIGALMRDNLTEHGRTINILARMNIYQEVVLATVYRSVHILQRWFEPVYFYIDTIFALHGMLVGALYVMTWLLSGSWLAGLLAAAFYIFNKEDTTRVSFVIPLRESFSLPFLWTQLVFITLYFKPSSHLTAKWYHLAGVGVCTFLFSITWQFNQFVLLLQAMALFAVQALEFVPLSKVRNVYLLQFGSLLAVCILQFGNSMILSGPCLSFLFAALCVMQIQRRYRPQGIIRNCIAVIVYIILVFLLMTAFNFSAKVITQQEADAHIGKFVLTKFGVYGDLSQRDFDVRLYLCNAAFAFIGQDVFERMTRTLVFPIYAYVHAVMVAIIVIAFLQKTSTKQTESSSTAEEADHMFSGRPDLAYHVIQTVFFGALAISTLRMKYLWTPYMCVLAAVGVSDKIVTTWLLERCTITSAKAVAAVRHFLTIAVFICFLHLVLPKALSDLEDLREFYDPDTVDLMNWIKKNTPVTAAFTGSMQLLAGVKLCTGRPVTNHPHYEDKLLRERTKQLYQMYGRRTPEEVHSIFMKYDVSYVILEDSICLAPSRGNCRLPDMIDIDNGVIPDSGASLPDLVKSKIPRFCDKIRHSLPEYTKLFKAVFTNKTFRVYKVLKNNSSKQIHQQKGGA